MMRLREWGWYEQFWQAKCVHISHATQTPSHRRPCWQRRCCRCVKITWIRRRTIGLHLLSTDYCSLCSLRGLCLKHVLHSVHLHVCAVLLISMTLPMSKRLLTTSPSPSSLFSSPLSCSSDRDRHGLCSGEPGPVDPPLPPPPPSPLPVPEPETERARARTWEPTAAAAVTAVVVTPVRCLWDSVRSHLRSQTRCVFLRSVYSAVILLLLLH